MSDMQNSETQAGLAIGEIDRRKLMGGMAALTAASTIATPALAAMAGTDPSLRTYRARYATLGGTIVDGFFAAPRGKAGLGVVLVMPEGAGAEEIALRYARNGYLAIAPDFTKAQGKASAGATRATKVAEVLRAVPGLKRTGLGNGRVAVVAA